MSFLNVLKTGKHSGIAKGVLGCLAAGAIFFGVSSVATNAGNENARREIVERSVTQSYIADNAEAVGISVAEGEQPVLEQVLNNKLLVKYTLADAAHVAPEDKIASLWESLESAQEKVIAQFDGCESFYTVEGQDDIYLAFVDATKFNNTGVGVTDWCFARNDGEGHVLENVKFDPETGIASIPRSEVDESPNGIQLQLLVRYDMNDTAAKIKCYVSSEDSRFALAQPEFEIEADTLDVSFKIPIAPAGSVLSSEDLDVYVNDMRFNLTESNSAYDRDSGELELGISPAGVTDIKVLIKNRGVFGSLAEVTAPSEAQAYWLYDSDIAFYNDGNTYFDRLGPGDFSVGDSFTYWTWMRYKQGIYTWSSWYGASTGGAGYYTDELLYDIWWGSWDDAAYSPSPWYTMYYGSRMMEMYGIFNENTGGKDFHTVGSYDSLILECCHVESPVGSAGFQWPGEWFQDYAFMRVLKIVDNGQWSYIICGFISPQTNAQSCIGLYKFRLIGGGDVELTKTANGNQFIGTVKGTPVKNAQYRFIYKNDQSVQFTGTTDSNGKIKLTNMRTGEWLVYEESAPWPYIVDPSAKTIKVETGKTTKLSVADTPTTQLKLFKYKLPQNGTTTTPEVTITSGVTAKAKISAKVTSNRNIAYTVTITGAEGAGNFTVTIPDKITLNSDISDTTNTTVSGQTITFKNNTANRTITFTGKIPLGWSSTATTATLARLKGYSSQPKEISVRLGSGSIAGAKYTIYNDSACTDAVATITTDANGQAKYGYKSSERLVAGHKYYIKETTAPTGYSLSTATLSFTTSTSKEAEVVAGDSFTTLQVQKVSRYPSFTNNNSSFSLSGAVYGIYEQNPSTTTGATPKYQITTDANGIAYKDGLEPKTYYVKEITASKGFSLDPTVYTATVTANAIKTVTSTEDIPVSVTIYKKSATPVPNISAYSLANATFGIYKTKADATAGTNAVAEVTSNASGKCTKATLPMAAYYIKEITPPPGFKANTTVYSIPLSAFQANPNQSFTVEDTPKTITITGSKTTDADTKAVALYSSLAGAQLSVYASYDDARNKRNPIKTGTTTSSGSCSAFTGLPPAEYYYVREDTAPDNYRLSNEIMTVHITNNLSVTTSIYDEGLPVTIIIKKTKADSSLPSQYSLAGAIFGIYKTKTDALNRENAVTTVRTDSSGTCPTVSGLHPREYWVAEIEAPNGFWLNDEPQKASFTTTTGRSVTLTFSQEAKYGYVKASKRSTNDQATPATNSTLFSYSGAKFAVYSTYTDAANATNENPGTPLLTMTTPASGDVTSTTPLIPGTYYMKELVAPKGYSLQNAVYTVTAVLDPNKTAANASTLSHLNSPLLMNSMSGPLDPVLEPNQQEYRQNEDMPVEQEEPTRVMLSPDTPIEGGEVVYTDANVSIVDFASQDDAGIAVDSGNDSGVFADSTAFSISDELDETDVSEPEPLLPGDSNKIANIEPIDSQGRPIIAVIDTGISGEGADKAVSIVDDDPQDYNGHGSDMIEIIRANAPDAYILSVKAFNADGKAPADAIYMAMRYAIDAGADVINMSFAAYAPGGVESIERLALEAHDRGIVVMGAAGNQAQDALDYCPANTAGVVAVGALVKKGEPQPTSNYGITVEMWEHGLSTSYACALASAKASMDIPGYLNKAQALIDDNENISDNDPVFETQATWSKTAAGAYSFQAPWTGTYTFSIKGGNGGAGQEGGYAGTGGTTTGKISLSQNNTIYVYVGGGGKAGYAGNGVSNGGAGGYNGGGKGGNTFGYSYQEYDKWIAAGGGGGGASHISKTNNAIQNVGLSNFYAIAGGGGGGAWWADHGGYGGGGNNNGGAGTSHGGDTTTSPGGGAYTGSPWVGEAGQNGASRDIPWTYDTYWEAGGGGGAGRYGGRKGWASHSGPNDWTEGTWATGGGGGSGYINSSLVTGGGGTNGSSGGSSGDGAAGSATITYGTTQTVKFAANGGTGSMSDETFTLGTAKALTSNAFTGPKVTLTYKYNYSGTTDATESKNRPFSSWKSSYNSSTYTNGQSVTNPGGPNIGTTTTMTAQWGNASFTLKTATRTGYKFLGWYDAATGGNKIGNASATYATSASKTLYAHWEQDNYYVKFDANGGTGTMANETFQRDIEKALTANAFTKSGCTFVGWSKTKPSTNVRVPKKDYNDKQSVKNIAASGATITLYAVWKADITGPSDATIVRNNPITTSIEILKKPASIPSGASLNSGTYSLAGAKFGIYDTQTAAAAATADSPGSPKATLTTTANGTTTAWTGAVVGQTYYIKELSPPTNGGYTANTGVFSTGAIVDQVVKTVTVTEPLKTPPVTIKLVKSIKSISTTLNTNSGTWSLSGAKFGVYLSEAAAKSDTETPWKVMSTNADGEATLSNIASRTYWIREISPPRGFQVNSTVYKAAPGSTTTITVNVPETPTFVTINIVKKNASPESVAGLESSYSLAGAVFEVYASSTDATNRANPVASATTNAQGKATITGLYPKTYYLREKTAPTNFTRNDTTFTVANSTVAQTVNVIEQPKVAHIRIVKTTTVDMAAHPELSLAGAVFGIYSDSTCTTKVQEVTTNASGLASTTALVPGTYYVKEISAPTGFKVNTTKKTVNTSSTFDQEVTFEEEAQLGKITLTKATNHPEWTSNLSGAKFGVYSNSACTTLVDTITTASDGTGTSKDLVWGTYYVKEIKALTNHAPDTTKYTVELSGATAAVNSGNPIVNKTTTITLTKQTAEGAPRTYPLTGAEYGVYTTSECLPGSEFRILTLNSSGTASTYPIAPGTYYLKEIKAPYGYDLDPTAHKVVVTGDTEATVVLSDTVTLLAPPGQPFTITKQSAETGTTKQGDITTYAGAEFVVDYYTDQLASKADAEGLTPTRTWVLRTGDDGVATLDEEHRVSGTFYTTNGVPCLPEGTIIISERTAPTGMLTTTTTYLYRMTETGLVNENGAHVDGVVVNIYDNPIRGNITFTKKDNNGHTMANMPFMISLLDSNGSVVERHLVFTDANGTFNSASNTSTDNINANDSLMTSSNNNWSVPSQAERVDTRLWFDGNSRIPATPNTHGSLPYGTYKIQELPCPENVGYILPDAVTVEIRANATTVNVGEFVNNKITISATNATDTLTGTKRGASTSSTIEDVVTYSNFDTTKTYTVIGTIYDKTANLPIYKNGDQALTATHVFKPTQADGSFTMSYPLEGFDVAGKDLAVKVTVMQGTEVKAEHNDTLSDANELVEYPHIATSATDKSTGTQVGFAGDTITIEDVVSYTNLEPNKSYTIRGTLHQATIATWRTGTAITGTPASPTAFPDAAISSSKVGDLYLNTKTGYIYRCTEAGNANTAKWEYVMNATPDTTPIWYTGTKITGTSTTATAFPSSGIEMATVGDKYYNTSTKNTYRCSEGGNADNAKWVYVEAVETAPIEGAVASATWRTGTKIAHTSGSATPDTGISNSKVGDLYLNKKNGAIYRCETAGASGVAVWAYIGQGPAAAVDAGPLLSSEDTPVTAEATFTPTRTNGTKKITFTFPNARRDLGYVVVFEDLYNAENVLVAQHEDIADDNQTIVYPKISTNAKDDVTGGHVGTFVDSKANVTDTVSYSRLTAGETYRLEATLMPRNDADAPVAINNNPITATATFTPTSDSGTTTVSFTNLPQSALEGKTVVVYEKLYQGDALIASHEEIADAKQQIAFPGISTTATDVITAQHIGLLSSTEHKIVDQIAYSGLIPDQTYIVRGTVVDKATGNVINGPDGLPATAEKSFKPTDYSGTVAVQFTLGPATEAFTAVVYEELYLADGTTQVSEHKDVNDEAQSVHYPKIGTTANDADTHDHEGANDGTITINDVVSYTNLIPNQAYTIQGSLIDKSNGQVLTDDAGNEITATATFTPTQANGTKTVTFTFNKAVTENKTVVIYETLYSVDKKIAEHADLTDAEQSVFFPKVRTTATDSTTNNTVGGPADDNTIKIKDTVSYSNLIVGHEYSLTGKLVDTDTGNVLLDSAGHEVVSTQTFTPTSKNGTVDVLFSFDAPAAAAGKKLVAFEYLYRNGYVIDTHADLNDTDQTVYYPHVATDAVDSATAMKVGLVGGTLTVTDTVTYDHLLPGEQYTLTATLYSKASAQALKNGTTVVTGSATFTPNAESGTQQVQITFPAAAIANGDTLVAYETLIHSGHEVAKHEDVNDDAQTVYYPHIGTTAVDATTQNHEGTVYGETTTIVDTISYSNLRPGVEYNVTTVLKNKADGSDIPTTIDQMYTTFTPQQPSGTFVVRLTVASADVEGKDTVVFERFSTGGKDIAIHEDLTDVNQSMSFPKIGTTATDAATTLHEGLAEGTITVHDRIDYENLVPGTAYTLTGTLFDKTTGDFVYDDQGHKVTGTTTFTPQAENGFAELDISCDYSKISGHTVVVFETLSNADNKPVAQHSDENDAGQTVSYPHIETHALGTATSSDGTVITSQLVPANRHVAITDTMAYTNLVPNTQYVVKTMIVFKDSSTEVTDASNRKIEKEISFTPTTANGTYTFELPDMDAFHFENVEVVIFEHIYKDGKLVGKHADTSSADQTLKFIPATDAEELPESGSGDLGMIQIIGGAFVAVACATGLWQMRKRRQKDNEQ